MQKDAPGGNYNHKAVSDASLTIKSNLLVPYPEDDLGDAAGELADLQSKMRIDWTAFCTSKTCILISADLR